MEVSMPNEPTAFGSKSSASVSRAHVAMIASSFMRDDGEMMEGGAERHLLHLAQLASTRGADVAIFQPSVASWVKEFNGFRVVGTPVTGRNSWRSSSLLAIKSGATLQIPPCSHLMYPLSRNRRSEIRNPLARSKAHYCPSRRYRGYQGCQTGEAMTLTNEARQHRTIFCRL